MGSVSESRRGVRIVSKGLESLVAAPRYKQAMLRKMQQCGNIKPVVSRKGVLDCCRNAGENCGGELGKGME